jgi:hypothetical protein
VKFGRVLILFILIAAFPALAGACTCSSVAPGQCPGLQPSDVVFAGTVTDVQLMPPSAPQPAPAPPPADPSSKDAVPSAADAAEAPAAPEAPLYRYHFQIDEKFAGPDEPEIDIFSGGDDGDCGYKFQKGEKYVVYTHQGADGRLFSTICDGTRPLSDATALIPQLRAMRMGKRVASVFGVLRRSDPPFLAPADDPSDPIASISLKLRSAIDRFQTNSGTDGVYNFYDVHAGKYNFTANLPAGTELTQKAQNAALSAFQIPEDACYEYDVYALPIGHIQGTVFGPDGKTPLPIASLELFRVGAYNDARPGYWGFQGARGNFQFDHVGPGEYVLVYNRPNRMDPNSPFPRMFYPGVASIDEAKTIVLKDGQTLQKVNLRVSNGYPSRQLKVVVKWSGVRPAGTVTVAAKADQYENPSANKIADGVYTFSLFDSANYTISAWDDLTPQRVVGKNSCQLPARMGAPSISVAGADTAVKEITLTFPKPTCTPQQ